MPPGRHRSWRFAFRFPVRQWELEEGRYPRGLDHEQQILGVTAFRQGESRDSPGELLRRVSLDRECGAITLRAAGHGSAVGDLDHQRRPAIPIREQVGHSTPTLEIREFGLKLAEPLNRLFDRRRSATERQVIGLVSYGHSEGVESLGGRVEASLQIEHLEPAYGPIAGRGVHDVRLEDDRLGG